MEPMKPIVPIEPMDSGPKWWPPGLGSPTSSGAQNGVRYAFFQRTRRLAIKTDGEVAIYDSGDYDIYGVSRQRGGKGSLVFSSQKGDVKVDELEKV